MSLWPAHFTLRTQRIYTIPRKNLRYTFLLVKFQCTFHLLKNRRSDSSSSSPSSFATAWQYLFIAVVIIKIINHHADQYNRWKPSPLLVTLPYQIVPTFSYKKETRIQGNSVNVLTKQRWSYLLDRYVVSKLEQTCTFLAGYQFYFCSEFFNVFVISFQCLPLACQAGSFISPCISSKETSEVSVLYCSLSSGTGLVTWLLISDCVGDNFWNCTDLNEKLLKTDYQS